MNILKKLNNDILWVTYMKDNKPKYFITSNKMRDKYFLYEVIDDIGDIKKIKTDKEPLFDSYILNILEGVI